MIDNIRVAILREYLRSAGPAREASQLPPIEVVDGSSAFGTPQPAC